MIEKLGARKININRLIIYLILIIATFCALYPLFWMLCSSFKSLEDLFKNPWLWPKEFVWKNYADIFHIGNIGYYALNSVIVCSISIPLMVFFSSMAAYAIAIYDFRVRNGLLYYFLSGQIIPQAVVIIPLFMLLKWMHLLGTRGGLALPYIAGGTPFAVFLMQGFFRTIPKELVESARIDGCSEFRIFLHIMLPLARPALASLIIFQTVWVWNDFIFPLLFANRPAVRTMTLGVYAVVGHHSTNYPLLFAGISMASIPIIVLYILFNKHFVKGIVAGAIKA